MGSRKHTLKIKRNSRTGKLSEPVLNSNGWSSETINVVKYSEPHYAKFDSSLYNDEITISATYNEELELKDIYIKEMKKNLYLFIKQILLDESKKLEAAKKDYKIIFKDLIRKEKINRII